ncbi:hypothetical protein HYZ97_01765 [Candidatus Pacearchaeota archaeon]|nr:hypothetical protein [Candidatus Pacearchaeota archaeon]
MTNRKGQATVFIIVALVIVAGIAAYFVVRSQLDSEGGDSTFSSVYAVYDQCIEDEAQAAIDLAGTQGGYVYVPEYDSASDYSPFSSHLNFLGFPVPYWFYESGNGLIKEQVPTKQEMEEGIANYVEEQLDNCDFTALRDRGYVIALGEPDVSVVVEGTRVLVTSGTSLVVEKDGERSRVGTREIELPSKLGIFYSLAKELYEKQKQTAFLENYSVDVLRLYAPVDGVEIQCSPKIWKTREVASELKQGLADNIASLQFNGADTEYFRVDYASSESVRTLYSPEWPSKVEIIGGDDELLIAEPVGTQEGLGILGFCYAPYHFVYNIRYPVLFQIYDGLELFQFPVVVILDKNLPRQGVFSELEAESEDINVCSLKTHDLRVQVSDIELQPVESSISYSCFNQLCSLGTTSEGVFEGLAPACVNGQLIVEAEGYADSVKTFSTSDTPSAEVILERLYNVTVILEIDGTPWNGDALISFVQNERTATAVLPDANRIQLTEGSYTITTSAYGNTSISIPASSTTQCVEVAQGGLLGLFGAKEERCFPIEIPASKIENALLGGGSGIVYLLPSDLDLGQLVISVESLPKPTSLQQLQYTYTLFESKGIEVHAR